MADIGKLLGKDIADLSKVLGIDASTVAKIYGLDFSQAAVIPAGLIVPYRSTGAAPAGWTAFTAANGRMIIGSYSGGYAIGATGGSNTLGLSLSASGNHAGTANSNCCFGGGSGTGSQAQSQSRGNHSHTATAYLYPPDRYMQLMKLNADAAEFPALMTCFAHQSFAATLTQYFNGEYRLFKAVNSGYSYSGSWTPANVYTTYGGSHNHTHDSGTCSGDQYASYRYNTNLAAGNHRHLLTMSACTNNIHRTRMTAWGASSAFLLEPGMIFMYENNTTLPAGWTLCDGTGGAPDLRSRLLEFGTTSNHGNLLGTGQITAAWSEGNHGSHHHNKAYSRYVSAMTGYHTANNVLPNAHSSSQNKTFLPPYYALAYIMYTG